MRKQLIKEKMLKEGDVKKRKEGDVKKRENNTILICTNILEKRYEEK